MNDQFSKWAAAFARGIGSTETDLSTCLKPGATGYSIAPSSTSVVNAMPSLTSGKVRIRDLLPDCVRGALRERVTGSRVDEYGYESVVDGFELAAPIDEAERTEARIIVAAALQPCSTAVIQQELFRLRKLTAKKGDDPDETAMQAMLYAEMLAEYPEDIVVRVCRDWPKSPKGEFWPAWAELGRPADRLLKERRDLADALARGPAKPREPDPEDIERGKAIAERDRQRAEATAWRLAHPELCNQPTLTWQQSLALTQGQSLSTVLRMIAGDQRGRPAVEATP